MAASITVHLQIFKRLHLPHFSTDLDETGIKIHGLLNSFIENIVIIRVAIPFKEGHIRIIPAKFGKNPDSSLLEDVL